MNLESPREHLGALDAGVHPVPLDRGDGRLGNPLQGSQLVLAELLQLPNDPNRLAHRDIDASACFPELTHLHFLRSSWTVLNDDRVSSGLDEFVCLFERYTGHSIQDLDSHLKAPALVEGRIELTLLGVLRYGLRSSDLAALLGKHPSSMTRWLNEGALLEREDPTFCKRIDHLDQQISAAALDNE